MNSLVNTMKADGTTNQTIGLVWAWMSLTGGGPFTVPTKDANYKYQDIIILMSDGLNTENRWDGNGSSQSIGSRCPHEPRLHQCEERRFDDLHGACEHRRRSDLAGAEELREQPEQLLHRDLVGSDQHRVQSDRLAALAAAHLEVTPLRQHGTNKKPGQSAGLFLFQSRGAARYFVGATFASMPSSGL